MIYLIIKALPNAYIKDYLACFSMKKEALLKAIAKRLRFKVLEMTSLAGSGHPTSCLSCAEIISCLFFEEMRYNVKKPQDLGNDEFVLSKGHASPILWAAYAEAGIIKEKALASYRKIDSVLEGHPTPRMPWVKAATGSLGQGLSIGLGMASALKLRKLPSRVFVLLGDGECAEGNVWEAAEIAAKYSVNNLTVILDCNRLGQSGETLHGHQVGAWQRKFAAFGWNTSVIDGHNIPDILKALRWARNTPGPCIIIAMTLKGAGVSFLEDKPGWHGKALKPDQLNKALAELGTYPHVNIPVKPGRNVKPVALKLYKPAGPKYKKDELVATRQAFGTMLEKLGKGSKIICLDGDVKNSTYSEKFKKSYNKQFIDCYIAEQNMVGMAAGIQAKGFKPFVCTFAAFLERAHDQIRMAAIGNADIAFVGSHCGVSIGEDGPSQMGLEDLSMFRCIPDSVILYPCDAVSAERCTALLARHKGIGFLRTSRPKTPVIYKISEAFKIGGCKVLKKPSRTKAVVIAAGVTVHEALKAAEIVKGTAVIDAYSIKPLDVKTIRKICKGKKVIVVEDHYAEGGLGEAVANLGIPVTHLAVKSVPRSGSPVNLMKRHKIDADAIVKALK